MGRLTGHPNIVGVLQVGETEGGYPYLVMQYHRRGSLDARIRRVGPLRSAEVLRLGVKIAGALETAHRAGILHRDIKPANILLTDYGEPALSDFGIAHIAGGFKTADRHLYRLTGVHRARDPQRRSAQSGIRRVRARAPPCSARSPAMPRSSAAAASRWWRSSCGSPREAAPDLRGSGDLRRRRRLVEKAMSRDPQDRPRRWRWVKNFAGPSAARLPRRRDGDRK